MNITEHLLTCLAEEAAELQQAVCKALRFGLDDGYPEKSTTNAEDIVKECIDLMAVIELLRETRAIPTVIGAQEILVKKAKVRYYMEYALERGTLVE